MIPDTELFEWLPVLILGVDKMSNNFLICLIWQSNEVASVTDLIQARCGLSVLTSTIHSNKHKVGKLNYVLLQAAT